MWHNVTAGQVVPATSVLCYVALVSKELAGSSNAVRRVLLFSMVEVLGFPSVLATR